MKIKILKIISIFAILIFVLNLAICQINVNYKRIKYHDISLDIPKQYLIEGKLPWLSGFKSGENETNSFRIKIPIMELQSHIINLPSFQNQYFKELTIIVFFENDNTEDKRNHLWKSLFGKSGSLKGGIIKYDENNKVYKMYPKEYTDTIGWGVFLSSPVHYYDKSLFERNSYVGNCNKDLVDKDYSRCFIAAPLASDKYAFSIQLDEDQLKYYKEIQSYILNLLNEWEIKK